jgi:hypothetical protein
MKNKPAYSLRCMAPDGATVREGQFDSVQDAWHRSQDMGSRWFFYPLHLVTGPARSDLARIVDAPRELEHYKGRTLRTLARSIAANSETACAWINGEALCSL